MKILAWWRRRRRASQRTLSYDQYAERMARAAFTDLGTTCAQDAVRRTSKG